MSDIEITYYNRSSDVNNSEIVIFQKNVATDFESIAVAWTVIKNCSQNSYHPFVYPMTMEVSATDSWGNFTSKLQAQNGQLFSMANNGHTGDKLSYYGPAPSPKEVQVRNDLGTGSMGANIYKSGKLLASKTNIVPGSKATFEFKPTIWVGAVSDIEEGAVMNSAILSDINTEISLLGIKSCDLVMTGGGSGTDSTPYKFVLSNVIMA